MIATRVRAALATVLVVPLAASCGFNLQTDQVYTPADGENSRAGEVDALNMLIVSETPGSGRLIGALVNNSSTEEDTLTGVVGAEEDEQLQFTSAGGETAIPPGELLQLADDEAAAIEVTGDETALQAGSFVRLTLTFQNAEPVTLNVPVLAPGEVYADVDLPDSSATASPAESPTESPSESPIESPGE